MGVIRGKYLHNFRLAGSDVGLDPVDPFVSVDGGKGGHLVAEATCPETHGIRRLLLCPQVVP